MRTWQTHDVVAQVALEVQDAPGAPDHRADEREEMFGRFQIVEKLGEGTYGKVYKAIHRATGEWFALKKIRIQYEEEGVPSTAIREVSLLKECDHPNVIKLHEVFSHPSALYLVFDYLDMDLRVFLKTRGKFIDPQMLKSASFQCTSGLEFCHGRRILHRDLKPQNVLVDVQRHRLKLADFGLARAFTVPLKQYTHEVVTLWYRAPEILLGQKKYATPMDIWSLGCIISEMATAQALFPGDSEIDTIYKIFRQLGTPDDRVWPGVSTLADYKREFPQWRDTGMADVRSAGPALGPEGVDLIRSCFRYNPVDRPAARRLLQHGFFAALDTVGRSPTRHRNLDPGFRTPRRTDGRHADGEASGVVRCFLCGASWAREPAGGICPDCQVEVAREAPQVMTPFT